MRDEIIGQLPLGYDREQPLQLTAVSYRDQVVAGVNYFIKVGQNIFNHNILHINNFELENLDILAFYI